MRFVRLLLSAIVMLPVSAQPLAAQATTCSLRPGSGSPVTAFVGVTLLSMIDSVPLPDQTVIVEGERITRVGPGRGIDVPRGARVVDGRRRWLMPGLVDAHVHTVGPPGITDRLFLVGLARGVTSAMVLSGDTSTLALRRQFANAPDAWPTLYVAGPLVDDSAMTYAEGRGIAESYRAAGYDLIKVYNQLSAPGYRGVMVGARGIGLPVVGHVVRSIGPEGALASGQRGITHMEEYLFTFFGLITTDSAQIATELLDTAAIPYLAAITAEAGVYVTPTLITAARIAALSDDIEAALSVPQLAYLGDVLADALRRHGRGYADRFPLRQQVQNHYDAVAFQRRMTRAFYDAGVPIVAGTDAPIAVTVPGFALHQELRNLVEAGLPVHAALTAATRTPAEYIGREQEFGTVEVGKRADLLLLDADPLEDIRNTERIAGVMTRGRWLDAAALDAGLACMGGVGLE